MNAEEPKPESPATTTPESPAPPAAPALTPGKPWMKIVITEGMQTLKAGDGL